MTNEEREVFGRWLHDLTVPLPESLARDAKNEVNPIELALREEEAKAKVAEGLL